MRNPKCRFACLIPKPASIFEAEGSFVISPDATIFSQNDSDETAFIANLLSTSLREVSGYEVPVVEQSSDRGQGTIYLSLNADESLGDEGYELSITTNSVRLTANCPAGLFYGV